ncbi:MAG: hypothetical protein OXR66_01100 [Candidatus Woesearchaeota archaeon]|nr:hypothetical protein [Candidatus Woesearchaeota archaeon]
MRWLLFLVLFASCTTQAPLLNETNTTENYGELVNFTLESLTIPLDGSIVITDVNTTKTVYMFAYCDIPLSLVRHDEDGLWRYVYPHIDPCVESTNVTLTPNMTIPLSSIPTRDGGLTPGVYRLKLFYSTVAPATHMRESRIIITITA